MQVENSLGWNANIPIIEQVVDFTKLSIRRLCQKRVSFGTLSLSLNGLTLTDSGCEWIGKRLLDEFKKPPLLTVADTLDRFGILSDKNRARIRSIKNCRTIGYLTRCIKQGVNIEPLIDSGTLGVWKGDPVQHVALFAKFEITRRTKGFSPDELVRIICNSPYDELARIACGFLIQGPNTDTAIKGAVLQFVRNQRVAAASSNPRYPSDPALEKYLLSIGHPRGIMVALSTLQEASEKEPQLSQSLQSVTTYFEERWVDLFLSSSVNRDEYEKIGLLSQAGDKYLAQRLYEVPFPKLSPDIWNASLAHLLSRYSDRDILSLIGTDQALKFVDALFSAERIKIGQALQAALIMRLEANLMDNKNPLSGKRWLKENAKSPDLLRSKIADFALKMDLERRYRR